MPVESASATSVGRISSLAVPGDAENAQSSSSSRAAGGSFHSVVSGIQCSDQTHGGEAAAAGNAAEEVKPARTSVRNSISSRLSEMAQRIVSVVSRSRSSLRAESMVSVDGPVMEREVRAWYVYDWANSPFWQVAHNCFAWHLKRSAEYAEESGTFILKKRMSPGSYPAAVQWVSSALQLIVLLSFSALGDYGNYRKQLLKYLTFLCCGLLLLTIFCSSGSMWWAAGLIRVFAGCCFVLCDVYYNAFLPLLTSQHHEVLALVHPESEKREMQLSDEFSSKGFGWGYSGGMCMQLLSFGVLFFFECENNCSEFDRLFWLSVCIALVGIWWASFSTYSFKHLKARASPAFPSGEYSIYCSGWRGAYETVISVARLPNTALFMVAFFIWSDALTTMQNVSVLYMDERDEGGEATKDSAKVLLLALTSVCGIAGVFSLMYIQKCTSTTNKRMLQAILVTYTLDCIACACGALDGNAYYLCMFFLAFMMGSLQAFTRSLFAALSPIGQESAMFALYALTDKGSSLIGSGVIGLVHTKTDSYLGVYWYCTLAFAISAIILSFVNVEKGMDDAGHLDGDVVVPIADPNGNAKKDPDAKGDADAPQQSGDTDNSSKKDVPEDVPKASGVAEAGQTSGDGHKAAW